MGKRLVKVQYREKGSGRSAVITLPIDIYDSWGQPKAVVIEEKYGAILVYPLRIQVYENFEDHEGLTRDWLTLKELENSKGITQSVSIADLKAVLRTDREKYGFPRKALLKLEVSIKIIIQYEQTTVIYEIREQPKVYGKALYELVYSIVTEELSGYPPDRSLKEFPRLPISILYKVMGPFLAIAPFYEPTPTGL